MGGITSWRRVRHGGRRRPVRHGLFPRADASRARHASRASERECAARRQLLSKPYGRLRRTFRVGRGQGDESASCVAAQVPPGLAAAVQRHSPSWGASTPQRAEAMACVVHICRATLRSAQSRVPSAAHARPARLPRCSGPVAQAGGWRVVEGGALQCPEARLPLAAAPPSRRRGVCSAAAEEVGGEGRLPQQNGAAYFNWREALQRQTPTPGERGGSGGRQIPRGQGRPWTGAEQMGRGDPEEGWAEGGFMGK
jgi:hypothetical protein